MSFLQGFALGLGVGFVLGVIVACLVVEAEHVARSDEETRR